MADRRASRLYVYSVLLAAGAFLVYGVVEGHWAGQHAGSLFFWLLACAGSNLLPAPVTPDVEVTMSGPVNLAIAYLFPPPVAAAVVALGSLTDWELRREISPANAAFNRAQLSIATAGTSPFLHLNHPGVWRFPPPLPAYHLLNPLFVIPGGHLPHGTRPGRAFPR